MSQETELQQLRDELKRVKELFKKRARRQIFGALILIIIIVIALLYAFVKQVEADRNAEAYEFAQQIAKQVREEAIKQQEIANELRLLLDECRSIKR